MERTHTITPDPMAAPEWLVERVAELSRLMSSSDRSVADGIWYDLIQRGLVQPNVVPGRVLGPLGWKRPVIRTTAAPTTTTQTPASVTIQHG